MRLKCFEITEKEFTDLVEFDKLVYNEKDRPSIDDYMNSLNMGVRFFVLKDVKDKKRLFWVGTYQCLEYEDTVYFFGVAVKPNYQRMGIGKQIIRYIEKQYPNKLLTCKSRPFNRQMKLLLKSCGFENNYDEIINGEYWHNWYKKVINDE